MTCENGKHPTIAYSDGKITCGVCGEALPKLLRPEQITRVKAGYTRSISWDRQLWTFPITLEATVEDLDWVGLKQTYLELYEEARKCINNAIKIAKPEFTDPSLRPESI